MTTIPREYWLNIFTDDDRTVIHDSRAEALAELFERAERRGEDRVTDYWRTICGYTGAYGLPKSYTYDLKYEADEAMDRADRERHIARYAPHIVDVGE